MPSALPPPLTRRRFLASGAAALASAATGIACPAVSRAASRPVLTHGLQSGDAGADRAMVWARADRPSRIVFEIAATERFSEVRHSVFADALPESGFAVKVLADGLPPGETVFYRARAHPLEQPGVAGEPLTGRFRTAPAGRRDVSFVWGGDVAGQGWGIDESRGGMTIFSAMRETEPDFFIHSGDMIYADAPLHPEQPMPGGGLWRNLVTPEKAKVAETLDEFRGNYLYNLLDRNLRAFAAEVPMLAQWDDHEVLNNWSPGKSLAADPRYAEKSVPLLAARAARAFHEFVPISVTPQEPRRFWRRIGYGPLLDVFLLDLRTYRGPDGPNRQTAEGPDSVLLGSLQRAWLKRELAASRALWKVIAASAPIGLLIPDENGFEGIAQGEAVALGRELEIADLLSFLRQKNVLNVVWVTADVHYAAAHHYDPGRAVFQDFLPFWEFVAGPLHAGTFGPGALDPTFGPEVRFAKAPAPGQGQNLPPSFGLQFFGHVQISGDGGAMIVTLRDARGAVLWGVTLEPAEPTGGRRDRP